MESDSVRSLFGDEVEAGSQIPSSATICPLIADRGNRQVLREWLSDHERYTSVDSEPDPLETDFDLCILDGEALAAHREELVTRKRDAAPVLLPVLLLLPGGPSDVIDTDRGEIADNVFSTTIDEIMSLPIRQTELEWRITSLLRLRRQSITAGTRNEELRIFRQAVESAGTGIYITDTEGTIQYVNPAFEALTGYTRAEAIGETPRLLDSGEMSDAYFAQLWETLLAGEVWQEEIVNERQNGEQYTAMQTIAPVKDGRELQAFVAIQNDITERKQREHQLKVLDRTLRHTLRNEMNVIRGHADVIRSRGSDAVVPSAEKIIEKSEQLTDLAEKEKTITTLQREEPQQETIEVCRLLDRIATAHRQTHPDATIEVQCPETLTATASVRFEEALAELVTNAIIHNDSPSPGVELTASHADGTVRIEVADDGPAIPEMECNILLEEAEQTQLYHGSGLGLWLVKLLVTRSAGSIDVPENSPRGTVIEILLPAGD